MIDLAWDLEAGRQLIGLGWLLDELDLGKNTRLRAISNCGASISESEIIICSLHEDSRRIFKLRLPLEFLED